MRQWPYLVDFQSLFTLDLTTFGGGKSTDTVLREGVFVLQHFFTGNLEENITGKKSKGRLNFEKNRDPDLKFVQFCGFCCWHMRPDALVSTISDMVVLLLTCHSVGEGVRFLRRFRLCFSWLRMGSFHSGNCKFCLGLQSINERISTVLPKPISSAKIPPGGLAKALVRKMI